MIIWPLVRLQLCLCPVAELHSRLFSADVGGEIGVSASTVINFTPCVSVECRRMKLRGCDTEAITSVVNV